MFINVRMVDFLYLQNLRNGFLSIITGAWVSNRQACSRDFLNLRNHSQSQIVQAVHKFRFLWSYIWPESLSAKLQLILCCFITLSTRVSQVLLPYYSKLIVDKLNETSKPAFSDVAHLVGINILLRIIFSSNGVLQTIHRNILDVTLRNETTRQVRVMERVVYTTV